MSIMTMTCCLEMELALSVSLILQLRVRQLDSAVPFDLRQTSYSMCLFREYTYTLSPAAHTQHTQHTQGQGQKFRLVPQRSSRLSLPHFLFTHDQYLRGPEGSNGQLAT